MGIRIPIISDIIDTIKGKKKKSPFDLDPTTKKYLIIGGVIFFVLIVIIGIYSAMQPSTMDKMMSMKTKMMGMKMPSF